MAKVDDWVQDSDKLKLLAAWARDGLTDKEIAERMGIARSTLNLWKKKFSVISDALKKGKEITDIEVENSLYQRALGYTKKIKKTFKCKRVEYDQATGRKIKEWEELVEGEDEVHVPADVGAICFWLKNRKPEIWKEKRAEILSEEDGGVIVLGQEMVRELEESRSNQGEDEESEYGGR